MKRRGLSSPLMGEVAAERPEWVLLAPSNEAATHSAIALTRNGSSPIEGEQVYPA